MKENKTRDAGKQQTINAVAVFAGLHADEVIPLFLKALDDTAFITAAARDAAQLRVYRQAVSDAFIAGYALRAKNPKGLG